VPKSRNERLEELAVAIRESHMAVPSHPLHELCLRLLEEIGKVEIPGVVQHALWGSISPADKLKITGEWKTDDDSTTSDLVQKVAAAVQLAVAQWKERECMRSRLSEEVGSFLPRAKRLEAEGHIEAAIDLINDCIDELFRRGFFAICDAILAETAPNDYSTDILLTILTATAPAKSELRARQKFFAATRRAIKARKEYERGLLDGLE
jgi:hypothetical protein